MLAHQGFICVNGKDYCLAGGKKHAQVNTCKISSKESSGQFVCVQRNGGKEYKQLGRRQIGKIVLWYIDDFGLHSVGNGQETQGSKKAQSYKQLRSH